MPEMVDEVRCILLEIDYWDTVLKRVVDWKLKYGFDGIENSNKPNARGWLAVRSL
jgi:hypothetical protein